MFRTILMLRFDQTEYMLNKSNKKWNIAKARLRKSA